MFSRKDTATMFQWRIRNLPYPISNYIVTVDDDSAGITIKTVNKKYQLIVIVTITFVGI